MSVTGFWLVITVADERVGDWRERYGEEFAGVAERREQAMALWAGLGDEALLKRHDQLGWRLTDAGGAYADLFWETTSEEWGGRGPRSRQGRRRIRLLLPECAQGCSGGGLLPGAGDGGRRPAAGVPR